MRLAGTGFAEKDGRSSSLAFGLVGAPVQRQFQTGGCCQEFGIVGIGPGERPLTLSRQAEP